MSNIWFIRGIPREFRERVSAEARKRRQTVGELVVELLSAGLERGHEAVDQAVNVTERLSRLEQDFRQMQDGYWQDGQNVWQQIERLTERVAALEGRGGPTRRAAGTGAGEWSDMAGRPSERTETHRRLPAEKADALDRLLHESTLNNSEIGRHLGVSAEAVRKRREALGLPPAMTKRQKADAPAQKLRAEEQG